MSGRSAAHEKGEMGYNLNSKRIKNEKIFKAGLRSKF